MKESLRDHSLKKIKTWKMLHASSIEKYTQQAVYRSWSTKKVINTCFHILKWIITLSKKDDMLCDYEVQEVEVNSSVHSHHLIQLLATYGPMLDGGLPYQCVNVMGPFYSPLKNDLYTNFLETTITQGLDTSSLFI